jgi:amino-acid N-acetyltransferase
MSEITITPATASDLDAIRRLLAAEGLPIAGVEEHWRTFVVAREGDRVIGCGGAEAYKLAALIRSIAIDAGYRGRGIGRRIVRQLLDRLASRGLREFYLLTTTAESYFQKRGFRTIERNEVHPQILQSQELQGACPDTAVCMRLVMLS